MNSLTEELRLLAENDPDLALVLKTFGEIGGVYQDSVEAMGLVTKYKADVMNSAEVTISAHPSLSSSGN